ncbi:MAG: MMPL family transporter [Pseudomonadota bacterium]
MTRGFGLEKLGLLAQRFPWITLAVIAALTMPLAFAAAKVEFSSDIREIFRSGTQEYRNLQMVEKQYPQTGEDVLLLVQAPDLFTRDNLKQLRELHLNLHFAEGVKHVTSMFSAHDAPDASGNAEAVFPMDLDGVDLSALRETLLGHPFVSEKLLSADAQTALFVVAIEPRPKIEDLRIVADDLRQVTDEALTGTDMQAELSGVAFFRLEIVGALIRDQRLLIGAGFAVSLIICLLFFRSPVYALLAGVPAGIAVLWTLGLTELRGQEITVLTGVVPGLVTVLVFASSLHLMFGIKRRLVAGDAPQAAIMSSVREIGPACVLAAMTTAIALLSLTLVPHTLVSGFGLTAAIGTAVAFLVTITVLPALGAVLLGRQNRSDNSDRTLDRVFTATGAVCARLGRAILARPALVLSAGLLFAVTAGILYATISPSYQYRDYLPTNSQSSRVMDVVDTEFGGTEAILLHVQWPKDNALDPAEVLSVVADAHKTLESLPLVTRAVSVHGIETWMERGGLTRERVLDFLEEAQSPLIERMLSADNNSALVTGYFPAVDASELVPVLEALELDLAALRAANPGVGFVATGIAPHSARASYEMIIELNRSLLIAIGLNILLIGLVFWSLRAGLYSMLTNVLPIAVAGAILHLTGAGLQFTCVVAFTIGFGIAVDNAIHILNYYRLMRSKGEAVRPALEETIATIGPALAVGCLVLIVGFGGTVLSELPSLRLFGQVVIMLLAAALLANLLVLPALIAFVEGRSWRPGQQSRAARQ